MACDFCSSPNVVKRFQCKDFDSASRDAGVMRMNAEGRFTNVVLNSRNYWAACANCAAYVDAEDLKGLTDYAADHWREGLTELNWLGLKIHLHNTYRLFFANRIRIEEPSFTCPECGLTSHNANDIEQGYCGGCHAFTGKK